MPRASAVAGDTSATTPNALRRNQACHRCRQKKLKCDALSPCGHCVKSHAHTLRTYPITTPAEPECIYDDPEEVTVASLRSKISKLERQIEELSDEISQKNAVIALCTCKSTPVNRGSTSMSLVLPTPQPLGGAGPANNALSPSGFPTSIGPLIYDTFQRAPSPSGADFQLSCEVWPLNIPTPDVLHFLVDTFFSSAPLAERLLHRPSFLAALQEAPSSPRFPNIALLHAICGHASLYTPIIRNDELDNVGPNREYAAGIFNSGIFVNRAPPGARHFPRRVQDAITEELSGFGAVHIRLAATSMRMVMFDGDGFLSIVQAAIICTWYCYTIGRPLDTYRWLNITRMIGPLGLWTSPGFEPLSRIPAAQLVVLPPPMSHTEDEVRRNVFWIDYCMHLSYTAGNVWPLICINDEDCSQVMPCRQSDFASRTFVPTRGRQQIFTPNMLVTHPPLLTDSFTLYIKASMLVARVKSFNHRFKSKHSAGDNPAALQEPRGTPEFQALDKLLLQFTESFPRGFRDPVGVKDGAKLDPLLYLAHVLPHTCMITLHDPHADVRSNNCPSAARLLTAARAILDLMYEICATSFDLLYLEHASSFSWFLAGATLIRFLKVKLDAGDEAEVHRLTQEIGVVRFMLSNLAERTVIGAQQIGLLQSIYRMEIGTPPVPTPA